MSTRSNGTVHGWRSLFRRRPADRDLVAYRRLALQLHQDLSATGSRRSVLLTSPRSSPVVARSAVLLACCAAEELDGKILLIDACLNDPDTSELLSATGKPGYAELRRGAREAWRDLVLPTENRRVSFLPAGDPGSTGEGTALALPDLLQDAERDYSLVILSGGSALDGSSALAASPHTGCTLITIVEGETRMADLNSAQDELARCQTPKIGLLMTNSVRRKVATPERVTRGNAGKAG